MADDYRISKHAREQMQRRGITDDMIAANTEPVVVKTAYLTTDVDRYWQTEPQE